MFEALGGLGAVSIGLYVYVAVIAGKAEKRSGSSWTKTVVKAATWPATIWSTINNLYNTKPE